MRPVLYKDSDAAREYSEAKQNHLKQSGNYLSPFRADLMRVMHDPFFRRLQGKTQLFPAGQSDYFRNRLTHSLEVSTIAEAIALKINDQNIFEDGLNLDLIRIAALCHDIGHPPFAHKGERALAKQMSTKGGFEGNAQTLHLLTKVAKLVKTGDIQYGLSEKVDSRKGLNLTARSLASVLKYDKELSAEASFQDGDKLSKGFYEEEKAIVTWIKRQVIGVSNYTGPFRTIECDVMDLADDIAYSVFDLEDALHAGFLRVTDLLAGGSTFHQVFPDINKELDDKGYKADLSANDIIAVFWKILEAPLGRLVLYSQFDGVNLRNSEANGSRSLSTLLRKSKRLAETGYDRAALTFQLMHKFIDSVEVEVAEIPALSRVKLSQEMAIQVECLKQFVAKALTFKSRVQVAEWRADHVISSLFRAIIEGPRSGAGLLPEDFGNQLELCKNNDLLRHRIVCDFIAGMTERYALEFYGRLYSETPETLFKPL